MNTNENSPADKIVSSTDGLAACPCGQTPTDVHIMDAAQGGKWAFVLPNCCDEWTIEFRTNYAALHTTECKRLAVEAWNSAPRAANAIYPSEPKPNTEE